MKQNHKVLIVDDEKPICEVLSASLLDEGYDIEIANDGEKALKAIDMFQPEVVLLDIWMPGKLDGIDVLQQAKQRYPHIDFIVMSGHGTIETAVRATKLGAWDFVEKPLSSDKIFILIKNILSYQQERNEKRALLNKLRKNFAILGHSQPVQDLKRHITRVAPLANPVFLEGPVGTGKTLVAQNIHYLSDRASQPFVEVNCRLVPQDLIDMQLFGFDKKHLIGVEETQKGHIDLAQGGTLFLKEISFLNKETQGKVLKLIQTNNYSRVGHSQVLQSDVRIILASTQDLKTKVKANEFLPELQSEISENHLLVPALKDRQEDIPVLIQHFSDFYAQESGTKSKIFENDSIEALVRYTWPGHVRELKNFVERVYIMLDDESVTSDILMEEGLIAGGNQEALHASNLKLARSMFEKQYILKKLEENNGNVSKTAEMIGLERSHLHRKMKTYGIET